MRRKRRLNFFYLFWLESLVNMMSFQPKVQKWYFMKNFPNFICKKCNYINILWPYLSSIFLAWNWCISLNSHFLNLFSQNAFNRYMLFSFKKNFWQWHPKYTWPFVIIFQILYVKMQENFWLEWHSIPILKNWCFSSSDPN